MNSQYVLKYDDDEIKRLNLQAIALYDTRLDGAIRGAKRILDLGCGPGTLLERIRKLNPDCFYLGLDADPKAIANARTTDARAEFKQSDISQPPLADVAQNFDLIICRLVLWALPNVDAKFIRALADHLAPGGVLYAFEPDDKNLTFVPEKPGITAAVRKWQDLVFAKGQNPFIGRELHTLFTRAGLGHVEAHPMTFAESGQNPEAYLAMMKNLKGIFASATSDGLEDFDRISPEDLVVEHHFSVFGRKLSLRKDLTD